MMKRFRGLVSLVVILIFGLAPASCAEESGGGQRTPDVGETSDPPNIIFVLADDLDAGLIEDAPGLKAMLADEGTTF